MRFTFNLIVILHNLLTSGFHITIVLLRALQVIVMLAVYYGLGTLAWVCFWFFDSSIEPLSRVLAGRMPVDLGELIDYIIHG